MGGTPRALSVAHLDGGRAWRGGQQQALALVTGLAQRGVGGGLLAASGRLAERAAAAGIAVAAWTPRGDLDVAALARAVAFLRRHATDVVHVHDARSHALGVVAARLAGVRAVVVSRRSDTPVGRSPASRLKYRLPVDRYLAVSQSVARGLRAAGISAERVVVVPDGVSAESPSAAPDLRAGLGLAPATPLVGVVAALTPEKGQDVALEAVARAGESDRAPHLVIVGEGPERSALELRARQLGIAGRVTFVGFRDDARALLRQLDVLVVPSRVEGLGTAAIEGLAEGVPVVASRTGGLPEIIEDGVSGWLVPPGDAQALARVLAEVLERPESARARAARGKERSVAWSVDRMVERTLDVYRELIRGASERVLDAPRGRG